MIVKPFKKNLVLILAVLVSMISNACFYNKVDESLSTPVASEKALVKLKGQLNTTSITNKDWVIAKGQVINVGGKRADWLQVTVYTKDKKTGVVLRKKTTYVQGSGLNGKSLEPGESGSFEVRLDTKQDYRYAYEAEISWSDAL